MEKTIKELATLINGKTIGDENCIITGVTNIDNPKNNFITFIASPELLEKVENTNIACIITPLEITGSKKTIIRTENPKLAFAKILQLFHPPKEFLKKISNTAQIAENTTIEKDVTIESFVVIGENVKIGKGSTIRSFSYIDDNVTIGENTTIHPQVTVYSETSIGNNVIIHSSTVIGADGFGYTKTPDGSQVKIPQVGNVIIEDHVEIGANCCIDRATFGSTILKKGVKLDNLVQVAHNVEVGENTAVSGHAGIAGSSKIGKNCTLAAQVGIADHCTIEDGAILGGQSGVPSKKRITGNKIFMGTPARPLEKFARQQGYNGKIPAMLKQIKAINEKINQLEHQDNPST